jgi:phage tail protein X
MKYVHLWISISSLVFFPFLSSAQDQQKEYFLHHIKKGESVSLICISYYGHYTQAMGAAVMGINPSLRDVNVIRANDSLKLRIPATAPQKTGEKAELFVKRLAVTQGVVTCVIGKALLRKDKSSPGNALTVNSLVVPGNIIETASDGRVEIIINRESVVRLKENTRLVFDAFRNSEKGQGKTSCGLENGTLWTKVRKFVDKISRFELSLPAAIAGVYGTVYETTVDKDSGSEVKVFNGEVAVEGKAVPGAQEAPGPDEVPGPGEVPGPHEVSMEEWTRIVRSMQKISITGKGTPSEIQNFQRDTASSWERWNEERDIRIAEIFAEQK